MNKREEEVVAIVAKAIPDNNEGLIIRELATKLGWGKAAAIILKHNPQLQPELSKLWAFLPGQRVNIGKGEGYGIIDSVSTHSGLYLIKEYTKSGINCYRDEYTEEKLLSLNPKE